MSAYNEQEIWNDFRAEYSFSKHLLIVYSLAVGVNARTIVDLGIGISTRALRLAAKETGGIVYSCDMDRARYGSLLEQRDPSWQLYLEASEKFIEQIPGPLDLVVHDAAHDYYQVKLDISKLLPKMKKFGLICVHDTQQPDLSHEMLAAIKEATQDWKISMVNLPFSAGLAIIRIEESMHPEVTPASGVLPDGRTETELTACPMRVEDNTEYSRSDRSLRRWLHWRLRKLVKGF